MSTSYDRHNTYICGRPVRHDTCARDFICGTCGGKLTTRWFDDEPHWRTVCTQNAGHSPDGFITKGRAEYLRHQATVDQAVANEVLSHLPAELQAAILAD